MDITSILIKPVLTEKSYYASLGDKRKYYFKVDVKATKTAVRNAFYAVYGISPLKINVLRRKPTRVKTGTRRPGYGHLEKIAIITLPPGVEILVTGEKPQSQDKGEKGEKKE